MMTQSFKQNLQRWRKRDPAKDSQNKNFITP